mgnify:CR=1 FL=1
MAIPQYNQNTTGNKFDAIIEYSGHAQQNLGSQFSFWGATGGGIMGYRSNLDAGTAIGVVSGATDQTPLFSPFLEFIF